MLQRGPQIAPREDPEVAEVLMQQFAEEGVEVVLNAQPSRLRAAQLRARSTDTPLRAQVPNQFLFQCTSSLDEQASIDRLV